MSGIEVFIPVGNEARSLIAQRSHSEASQKFDYFVTGLTGALCAYIVQNWKPHRVTAITPDLLEAIALVILFLAAVAGFKRIEWTLMTMQANVQWLRASEECGAMADAVHQNSGGMMYNAESGEVLSLSDAMGKYKALSETCPEIRRQMDSAADRAGRWYEWRNRLLVVGFLVLVAGRGSIFFLP
jgi:hypothetical protein